MSRPKRHDPVAGKRMRNAAFLFAAAMFCLLAAIAWTIMTAENGQASDAMSLAICTLVLVVLGVAVNLVVAFGKLRWWYRCPQCQARLPQPAQTRAGDPIRYVCAACDVEWDTGWEVAMRDDQSTG